MLGLYVARTDAGRKFGLPLRPAGVFDTPKEAAYIPPTLAVSARGRQWRFATRGRRFALSKPCLSVPGRPGTKEGAVPHKP